MTTPQTTPQRSQPDPRFEPSQQAQPDPALIRAFALLGEPWNGLIIAALAKGPAGFAQVRERVPGISDDTLADRLRHLTTVDLVTRTARPGPPPHSRYALAPHGNAFLIPLAALTVWAQDHLPARDSPTAAGQLGPHS
ncbi:helix-turn-helix domain-containing protein [Streptomyces sp. SID12488]|uniref:winged helix-turn-helix transcriptional regulator n=1 Tax=Streptomyces sp. SID12488 TaxID=2706040 RepID=UPI0013D9C0F3|nr:helix-turn-helix domain-containing protein [Streptomyces sp. SID12488]NEA67056.1 helix-turn-helix transcriptional regulator [Streptomyces sp. SID12488]